jgi:hypothetical protein
MRHLLLIPLLGMLLTAGCDQNASGKANASDTSSSPTTSQPTATTTQVAKIPTLEELLRNIPEKYRLPVDPTPEIPSEFQLARYCKYLQDLRPIVTVDLVAGGKPSIRPERGQYYVRLFSKLVELNAPPIKNVEIGALQELTWLCDEAQAEQLSSAGEGSIVTLQVCLSEFRLTPYKEKHPDFLRWDLKGFTLHVYPPKGRGGFPQGIRVMRVRGP